MFDATLGPDPSLHQDFAATFAQQHAALAHSIGQMVIDQLAGAPVERVAVMALIQAKIAQATCSGIIGYLDTLEGSHMPAALSSITKALSIELENMRQAAQQPRVLVPGHLNGG